jgi:hypothetical protein
MSPEVEGELRRWEAINLCNGLYCGCRELQKHGFPYKQFDFIPPEQRHSAMVSHQRAIKVLAATLRMNVRGGTHEQTR